MYKRVDFLALRGTRYHKKKMTTHTGGNNLSVWGTTTGGSGGIRTRASEKIWCLKTSASGGVGRPRTMIIRRNVC